MAIIETLVSLFSNFIIQIMSLALVGFVVFFKLGGKLSTKTKVINRAEIIRRKLLDVMKVNKSEKFILTREKNPIGIITRSGFYQVNEKKVYMLLFMPILFRSIPQFWNRKILIISEDFLSVKVGKILDVKIFNFPIFSLKPDYFFDEYFKLNLNFEDDEALNFLKVRLLADESEVSSSVNLAQAMRLTTVDFSKVYQPTPETVFFEKLKERTK